MLPSLDKLVGLPENAARGEVARAAEQQFEDLFTRAGHGDIEAQRGLVGLRSAYLVWAYKKLEISRLPDLA